MHKEHPLRRESRSLQETEEAGTDSLPPGYEMRYCDDKYSITWSNYEALSLFYFSTLRSRGR